MYDMNDCYKIIFEAMAEDLELEHIAEKICGYVKCGIAFLSGNGRLMGAAGFMEKGQNEFGFLKKGHLSWEDYEQFFSRKQSGGRCLSSEPVYDKKQITGYILLAYKDKNDTRFFGELGSFLAQIFAGYFAKEQDACIYNQSLRRQVIAWTMMEDDSDLERIQGLQEGGYMAALFGKTASTIPALSAFLREYGAAAYVYEDRKAVRVLFCKLNEPGAERIRKKMDENHLEGVVSELFPDRRLCRARWHLLKRIAKTRENGAKGAIKRERDWFLPGIYTYATPLIEEAELSDYAIRKLIEEDREKNTDLYHTLKTYLVCENNITAAAKKLHIHRNTLVYRLKQIETCLGVDLNDTEHSWDLLAFTMMYDLAGEKQEKR